MTAALTCGGLAGGPLLRLHLGRLTLLALLECRSGGGEFGFRLDGLEDWRLHPADGNPR